MKSPEQTNILVVGDIMLDKYTVGNVERISPEAPVPVVHVSDEYSTLGGCGNVIRNLRSIGANVTCLSAIAPDSDGNIIDSKLKEIEVLSILAFSLDVTIVKERIVANSRKIQILRVDREQIPKRPVILPEEVDEAFENRIYDCAVISDYAKGTITGDVVEALKSKGVPIIVDPKPVNQNLYKDGVFMITPNEKEWGEMNKDLFTNIPYVLITKGKHGMEVYDFNKSYHIPAYDVHQVFNVSGAGDTVVATMAICHSMGINVIKSARIANQCASYVVTQPGTTPVPRSIFTKAMLKEQVKWNQP